MKSTRGITALTLAVCGRAKFRCTLVGRNAAQWERGERRRKGQARRCTSTGSRGRNAVISRIIYSISIIQSGEHQPSWSQCNNCAGNWEIPKPDPAAAPAAAKKKAQVSNLFAIFGNVFRKFALRNQVSPTCGFAPAWRMLQTGASYLRAIQRWRLKSPFGFRN